MPIMYQGPPGTNGFDRNKRSLFLMVNEFWEGVACTFISDSRQRKKFFNSAWSLLEEKMKDIPKSPKYFYLEGLRQEKNQLILTLTENNVVRTTISLSLEFQPPEQKNSSSSISPTRTALSFIRPFFSPRAAARTVLASIPEGPPQKNKK